MTNTPTPHDNPSEESEIREQEKLDYPSLYKVILHNDDYTPMDFVVKILQKFFQKNSDEATQLMLLVHHTGMAVCGTYTKEIAETKVQQVTDYARVHGHPLKSTMEKE